MSEKAKVTTKAPEAKRENIASQTWKPEVSQAVSSPIDYILHLHQTIGNQAVERLFKSGVIQAKLKIGQPNDIYEQEADRVADEVMRMPDRQHIADSPLRSMAYGHSLSFIDNKPYAISHMPKLKITPLVQRQIEEEEEREEEEILQPKEVSGQTPEVTPDFESRIQSLKGGGQPLPKSVRTFFEPRFGHDFSYVRIHTDDRAAESAQTIHAIAYTVGKDVIFGSGQYAPETMQGKRLLAHELTHVVQQNISKAKGLGITRNISSSSGLIASRWKVAGTAATVTKKGDTLWGLSKRITGDGRNWPLIKKIKMQSPKAASPNYWLYLWVGDTFDISNLLKAAPGQLTIGVTQKAKSLTNCSSAEYKVQWSVSGKQNGWVIQHVKFEANATDCAGKKQAPKNPDGLEYWEGWEVKKGQVYVGFASGGAKHQADTFRTADEGAGTKGTVSITGKVRFIKGYNLTVPPWGYTVPEALSLPTMKKQPKGWTDAGAQSHTMKIVWDCCGKVPKKQTVTTTP
jgi:hypothetical protein